MLNRIMPNVMFLLLCCVVIRNAVILGVVFSLFYRVCLCYVSFKLCVYMLSAAMLSIVEYKYATCYYTEGRYAECHYA